MNADTVQILTKVELKNVKTGMKMVYTIVAESEANLKLGKISVNTPIAQGLLGKKVGDVAEITIPQGKISLEGRCDAEGAHLHPAPGRISICARI